MRFIRDLNSESRKLLERMSRHSNYRQVRDRYQYYTLRSPLHSNGKIMKFLNLESVNQTYSPLLGAEKTPERPS
ncbi:MAG: hypothetical protein F6K08_30945 [Okeania sp. SIO1H6]|nr:hypothetical protein [Okeania sp. SIO1H6]